MESTLAQLEIPEEFARYEDITETTIIIRLEEWRRKVSVVLNDLRAELKERETLTLDERARVISTVAPFDGEAPWVLGNAREQAQEILQLYDTPDIVLLERILSHHVKPVFRTNTHPSLNISTGRTLPRPAGGPLAGLDHLEGQTWKAHPGVVQLVSWCVRHCEGGTYEKLWYLIIPPVMTLLDDYQAPYKLQGIGIVSDLLQRVPADLLRRTGVDELLFSSLKTCLTYLHNPETPSLIRAAILTSVSLILLSTPPGSAKQFEHFCAILGDGIIGSVWLYATRESDAIQASVDVLPEIVQALGIGTARYLKAIVPQLVYPLLLAPENTASKQLQLSSLRALAVVIEACAPRMHKWKGTILDGVLRCWVTLTDIGADDDQSMQVKHALKEVCERLLKVCPSLSNVEYARLLQADEKIFGPLVKQPDMNE